MCYVIFTHRPPSKKPISWANMATRIKTRGPFDHVAYLEDGQVYESVIGEGVQDISFAEWIQGREGTIITMVEVPQDMYSIDIYKNHEGKKYDTPALIWIFLNRYKRLQKNADIRQYCSELMSNMRKGEKPYLNSPYDEFKFQLGLGHNTSINKIL